MAYELPVCTTYRCTHVTDGNQQFCREHSRQADEAIRSSFRAWMLAWGFMFMADVMLGEQASEIYEIQVMRVIVFTITLAYTMFFGMLRLPLAPFDIVRYWGEWVLGRLRQNKKEK